VTVPDEIAHLVTPGLAFPQPVISDSGSQWLYAYCVESTMLDGALTVHLDQAAFASGSPDATMTLVPGSCTSTAASPGPGAHATYTMVSSGGEAHTTAV